jgi:hypothetical protein
MEKANTRGTAGATGVVVETGLAGWAERIRTRRCHFEKCRLECPPL